MKSLLTPLALALALAMPFAHAAEDIYRSTMPDGSIRYGESPDPKAKSVKKVPAQPSQTGVIVVRPGETAKETPSSGGVAVLPTPPRPPNDFLQPGALHKGPTSMPSRGY